MFKKKESSTRFLSKALVTLTLLTFNSGFAETTNTHSTEVMPLSLSGNAMDYLPDVRLNFESLKQFPLLRGTEDRNWTEVALNFSSNGKTASSKILTLKNPTLPYTDDQNKYVRLPNTYSFSLRLWDIYAAAISKGLSPENLEFSLSLSVYSPNGYATNYNYLKKPAKLEDLNFTSTPAKLVSEKVQAYHDSTLHLTVELVGYKAQLFENLWSWKELLPASNTLSSRFLNLYSKNKKIEPSSAYKIKDLLDLFYVFSKDKLDSVTFEWPSNSQFTSDPTRAMALVKHINDSKEQARANSTQYWTTIASYMSDVVEHVQNDLNSSQRDEVLSQLWQFYPRATTIQITSINDTQVNNTINNHFSANIQGHSGLAKDSAVEAYYQRMLQRLSAQEAADTIEAASNVYKTIKSSLYRLQ